MPFYLSGSDHTTNLVAPPAPANTSHHSNSNQENQLHSSPQPVPGEGSYLSHHGTDGKRMDPLSKVEDLQVKFLRLLRRIGQSQDNLVVAKKNKRQLAYLNWISHLEYLSWGKQPATDRIREVVGTVNGIKITFIDTPAYYRSVGPAIWFSTILVMTHCSSDLPEGPNGFPVNYESYVTQCTDLVQHYVQQAVSDTRLENPVLLVRIIPIVELMSWGRKFFQMDSIQLGPSSNTRLPSLPHLLSSFYDIAPHWIQAKQTMKLMRFYFWRKRKWMSERGGPEAKGKQTFQRGKFGRPAIILITKRYRCLVMSDQWLVRPVLDPHGWDHDVGFDGINLETTMDLKGNLIASVTGQMSKDKQDFSIQSECAAVYTDPRGPNYFVGLDVQSAGKDLIYTVHSNTKMRNLKHNLTECGFSMTSFRNKYCVGAKLEDTISIGKRLKFVMNVGQMGGLEQVAYGGSFWSYFEREGLPC
ncbi:Translocase of chloroplast 90, chloroplastic [Vitis vinifera]|uniref:Translocase of chloroplast 90, chloroplastic n=1 Tax=Vitis vinifera TaxID=29760 RepID=A0A438E855_VITVI|nr:Translocase of chloroplast 90, chloroplastic [Vitis vinifera]